MKRARKYIVPNKENGYKPYILRTAGIVGIMFLLTAGLFGTYIQRLALKTGDFIATILPAVLVDLANSDRSADKLHSLAVNSKLEAAAQLKANDMATKGYFSHNTPEGNSPWYWFRKAGYDFVYAGENLAINFGDSAAVDAAWMNSPGHRANILNGNYTEIGIATSQGVYQGKETTFVVELFGSPAEAIPSTNPINSTAAINNSEKTSPDSSYLAVASSSVLGESESQSESFISVMNPQAVAAATTSVNSTQTKYSSIFERLVSSPTKLLAIYLSVVALLLVIVLIVVASIRHDERLRNVILVFILAIILFTAYICFKSSIQLNTPVL